MENDIALTFDDITLVPRYSNLKSRNDANPSSCGYSLPLAMTPMDLITTPKMIKCFLEHDLLTSVHRYFKTPQEQFDFIEQNPILDNVNTANIFYAIGSVQKHKEWIDWLYMNRIRNFLIDMAHGDTEACIDTIKYIKCELDNFYGIQGTRVKIIAGNVCTRSGFERLQEAGADYIRCGIAGGSICATSMQTGFGFPQFSAIQDCATRKSTAKLISCGGIKHNGDIIKAMAAGADLCMCGKLFAGTDLAGGECYDNHKKIIVPQTWLPGFDGKMIEIHPPLRLSDFELDRLTKYKEYYGMASRKAREGVLNYGSVEGVSGLVKYTGRTEDILEDIKLNLQAGLSYNGSRDWKHFKRTVKIKRISNSAILESRTHVEEE